MEDIPAVGFAIEPFILWAAAVLCAIIWWLWTLLFLGWKGKLVSNNLFL
jgi:hypothetical protein